jgi:transketolase
MHTIKPLDKEALVMAVDKVPAVITLEEHTVLGGLGSACAEIILEEGFNEKKSFKRIGIPDVFPEGYGNQKDMMARNGISVSKIVRISEDLLKI